MVQPSLHLIKLSVGTESPESLAQWQMNALAVGPDGAPRHVTRMRPTRGGEIVANGGSIYWVIRGFILARQKIVRFDDVMGEDGIKRTAIVLERAIVRTIAVPKRPFQGWRYLKPADAPKDLTAARMKETPLPEALQRQLADMGLQ